jgi:hypothetical protein
MTVKPQGSVNNLVNRLAHALAGTEGRSVSIESLRSLADLEISEWKHEAGAQQPSDRQSTPLIAGAFQY